MSKQKLTMIENVRMILRDRDGNVISDKTRSNTIVNEGRIQVALMLGCGGPVPFRYIELGTGNAIAASDKKLTSYIASTRAKAFIKRTNYCCIWTHLWTQGEFASGTIREAGLFQQVTANVGTYMLSHATISVSHKTINDSLEVQWQIGVA